MNRTLAVKTNDLIQLTQMVFEAKTGESKAEPKMIPSPQNIDKFVGKYEMDGQEVEVENIEGRLVVNTNRFGQFTLIPTVNHQFFVEDLQQFVQFNVDENGKMDGTIRWVPNN